MIAFETLLLGIIFGRVPIRVMVAPPVTTVEFRLDGASIGTLVGPPWVIEHDFGRSPLPPGATLAGAPLPVTDPSRIAVPNVDLAQPHLLSVEVAFPHNLQARTDLAFGGDIIDTAARELTAVAVAP